MSDDRPKPTRIPEKDLTIMPERKRNWLGSNIERVNEKANIKLTKTRAELARAQLDLGNIQIEHKNAESDYKRAEARLENVDKEIERDIAAVDAETKQIEEMAAKAKAEADQVVGDYEAKAEEAATRKKNAFAEGKAAELKALRIQRQIDGLDGDSSGEERTDLLRQKVELEAEIAIVTEQFEAVLQQDGEAADAKRRAYETALDELKAKLAAVQAGIRRLDGEDE